MTDWFHGWRGLLFIYGVTAAGVLFGLIKGQAKTGKIVSFLLLAIPAFLLACLPWLIITELLTPESLPAVTVRVWSS
jgi:4-amino-4-deoxy-L-arabinose transferase-like glycosyltransferase